MLDPDLLAIVACPATGQTLRLADSAELERVNALVAAGELKNVGGAAVSASLDAGLVREDGQIVYPVRDAIPVLLIDEGIALA